MKSRLAVSLDAVSVRRGETWALRNVSWQLRPGQRWALLGENGAGKTQLLKVLCGDVWPTPVRNATPSRAYRLGDAHLELIDAKARIAYIGGERQDKYSRYDWNLRVRDVVATGLHGTDLKLREVTAAEARRVAAELRACGLTRHAARKFLALSYGEKRLVLLARALVQRPDWLLLDEFYNGLDMSYRRRMDTVLAGARRRGQSWVATAHRADDVPRGTGMLLKLAGGRVVAERALLRGDIRALQARAGEPLERIARLRAVAAPRRARQPLPLLVSLEKVDLYVDYRRILTGVDWQLRRGEQWAVFGANGAGKSSFLKLLYGDLAPALGGVLKRAGIPAGTPITEWKRQVGLVSPELQSTYLQDVSLMELVASGRHSSIGLVDALSSSDRRIARRWLKFFDLSPLAERRPRELSYGQLRRALIARAMAADATILLLDEPLTGLDPEQRLLMKNLLQRLMKRGVTLVAAVHHPEDLPPGMTHGLRLYKRRAAQCVLPFANFAT